MLFRVYPRICGACPTVIIRIQIRTGLSPSLRGLLRNQISWVYPRVCGACGLAKDPGAGRLRSIPASAGPATTFDLHIALGGVYPRVCGACVQLTIGRRIKEGLSPHLRGLSETTIQPTWRDPGLSPRLRGMPTAGFHVHLCPRSIPASAGPAPGCLDGGPCAGVYPRVCGACTPCRICDAALWGLSPRLRGLRDLPYHGPEPNGVYPRVRGACALLAILSPPERWVYPHVCGACLPDSSLNPPGSIPASAGPARKGVFAIRTRAVHPRACGACHHQKHHTPATPGLSPRLRGLRPFSSRHGRRRRSIPASAGPAYGRFSCPSVPSVYPRVCGACCCSGGPQPHANGLSPRLRGLSSPTTLTTRSRVYPPRLRGLRAAGVELVRSIPRVCGACALYRPLRTLKIGLSPRLRGLAPGPFRRWACLRVYPRVCGACHVRDKWCREVDRSIPASSGPAWHRSPSFASGSVYPRVCGACVGERVLHLRVQGLSPRLRGLLLEVREMSDGVRSIPASAGPAATLATSHRVQRVYPRICGACYGPAGPGLAVRGLSPRLRGLPRRRSCWGGASRSIPASAGPAQGAGPDRGAE